MSEPISDEALWDFAESLADAWGLNDDDPRWIAEDFRDRFVARFGYGSPHAEPSDDYEAGYAEGFHHGVSSPRGSAESDREQGEPSDAQVQAAGAVLYQNWESFDFDDPTDDWERGIYDLVRAALRAAGGAR